MAKDSRVIDRPNLFLGFVTMTFTLMETALNAIPTSLNLPAMHEVWRLCVKGFLSY